MPRCSFCKENYEWPRGLTLLLNDGNSLFFCSSKCRKNFELKRDNKKVKWVKKAKNKEEKPKEGKTEAVKTIEKKEPIETKKAEERKEKLKEV